MSWIETAVECNSQTCWFVTFLRGLFYKIYIKTAQIMNENDVKQSTPQPLYNTIVGVQANFHVSYPNLVISRVKCIGYMRKGVLNSHLESNPDPCCIQNCVIMNRVIKTFRCINILTDSIYRSGNSMVISICPSLRLMIRCD